MNGWLTPGDVFHECTLDSLPEELGDIGIPTIGVLESDPVKQRAAYEEIHRDWLIRHGCIQVDEFHGLARFRGRGDRLVAAWDKMVELAKPFDGIAIEKVSPSSDERPSPASERPRPSLHPGRSEVRSSTQ